MKHLLKLLFLVTFLSGSVLANEPKADYIELTESNMVFIKDEITYDSIAKVQKQLSNILAERGSANWPVYIVFLSGGGSVDAGLVLYEQVKPYKNINTIVLKGYSMAAILPQLISGHRYIIETGELMLHRISRSFGRPGNPDEIQSLLDSVKKTELFVERKILQRSKISKEEYRRRTNENWWITADEAVELALADEIVTVKCSKSLIKKRTKSLTQILPFLPAVEVETSACPLLL